MERTPIVREKKATAFIQPMPCFHFYRTRTAHKSLAYEMTSTLLRPKERMENHLDLLWWHIPDSQSSIISPNSNICHKMDSTRFQSTINHHIKVLLIFQPFKFKIDKTMIKNNMSLTKAKIPFDISHT